LFGNELVVDFLFDENKDYIRNVLQQQVHLREIGWRWVDKNSLPDSWPSYEYQRTVNADGIPSEEIVDLQLEAHADGAAPHPGDELLERARRIALDLREGQRI